MEIQLRATCKKSADFYVTKNFDLYDCCNDKKICVKCLLSIQNKRCPYCRH